MQQPYETRRALKWLVSGLFKFMYNEDAGITWGLFMTFQFKKAEINDWS